MSGRTLLNGRYELDPLPVPGGAMGQVWFGRDTTLGREIAVKFVRFVDGRRDDELVRRFRRESRITARLEHPGVPAVYDGGEENGRPFLVMQRIRGINLADLLAEQGGPLPIGWAAAIAAQVCSVLSAAHEAKLVHRDLKPANLMLEPSGAVKVLDFGLAVAPTLSDFSRITQTGHSPGTPVYMAPEQFLRAGEPGPATDLYALGCILHEMLSGARPFDGPTSYVLSDKHVHEPPPALRGLRADVPARLERLVLDLLAKKPEDRPADADLVYQRLLPFVRDLGPLPGALDPPSRRSPVRMYAGLLSRVYADVPPAVAVPEPSPAPEPPSPPAPRSSRPGVDPADSRSGRGDLARARTEASRLASQSRYGQAAEVLASAIEPASRAVGGSDRDVIESRQQLADMWFDSGDYRPAARAYAEISSHLHLSDDIERVLHCRKREATCHTRVGETNQALRELEDLLHEVRPVLGDDDPRTVELRRDIAMLQLSAGQRHGAAGVRGRLSRDR